MSEPGWRVEVFGPNAAWEELVGHGCTTFAMASEYVAKFASGACYMPPLRLVSEDVYAPSPISLNQPSPLVKAEALALLADDETRKLVEMHVGRALSAAQDRLDTAFEAEFDLLPEDAKPLCDTFYRNLRKRLGHPVEAAIERSAAANGALTFQLLFRSADEEPTEPGWYLLYNQCDGFHQVEARCDEDGEFTGFREWCANDYWPKDGYCAWARLPDTGGALYDTFARTVPTRVRECD